MLEPFIIYKISDAQGNFKHSSIAYVEATPGVPLSADELRQNLLIAASYAGQDFEWPEHGDGEKADLTLEIYGPFFPGEPVDKITGAEFHALDEDDLP